MGGGWGSPTHVCSSVIRGIVARTENMLGLPEIKLTPPPCFAGLILWFGVVNVKANRIIHRKMDNGCFKGVSPSCVNKTCTPLREVCRWNGSLSEKKF